MTLQPCAQQGVGELTKHWIDKANREGDEVLPVRSKGGQLRKANRSIDIADSINSVTIVDCAHFVQPSFTLLSIGFALLAVPPSRGAPPHGVRSKGG